jgi:endoglycosylceramidase
MRACLLAFVALALGCPSEGVLPVHPWHTSGDFLRDRSGRAVVLRGVNVGAKHAPWFDFQGPSDFARIRKDWGMNSVRLLVLWAAVEPQKGQYDDAYLDALADRVRWASDANLAVVLDMHQDVYGEGFAVGGGDGAPLWTCDAKSYASFVPADQWFVNVFSKEVMGCWDGFWSDGDLQAHYVEAWRRVAKRCATFENVIGFDPMNEPYWGSYSVLAFEQDKLQPLYERITAAVRGEAPGWIAFLEPSALRNGGGHTNLTTPSFGNFVYAPHSYDRNAESGNGFDPMSRQSILTNVSALADEARELGAPLWIGEYGGMNASPGIAAYMTAQYDATASVAASSMYWSYSKGSYGMIAMDGSEAQPLVDTLVRPYPERVAGDPIDWSWDAGVFTLRWHPQAGQTIISVPSRSYPKGYTVDCGCKWHTNGASLIVDEAPNPATLVVR